jgi:hypothetical protein
VGDRLAVVALVALLAVAAVTAGVFVGLQPGNPLPFFAQPGRAAATEKPPPKPTDLNGVPLSYWPDACRLVSGSDVSQAFGGAEFTPAQPGSGRMGALTLPRPTTCVYQSTDYQLGATVDVTVMSVSRTAADAARSFASARSVGAGAPTDLPGVGQQAVWFGGSMAQVRVQQHRVAYQVGVALTGSQTANAPDRQQRELSAAEALARIAAGRIP